MANADRSERGRIVKGFLGAVLPAAMVGVVVVPVVYLALVRLQVAPENGIAPESRVGSTTAQGATPARRMLRCRRPPMGRMSV